MIGNSLNEKEAFKGRFTDFHIWRGALEDKHVENFGNCNQSLKGDYFNWDSANLMSVDWKILNFNSSSFCSLPPPIWLLDEHKFEAYNLLCQQLGGYISVFDKTAFDELTKKDNKSTFLYFWTGFTDEKMEGRFVDERGNVPDPSDWLDGEPDGKGIENCAVLDVTVFKLRDHDCKEELPAFCKKKTSEYSVRGIPNWLTMDSSYFYDYENQTITGSNLNKISFGRNTKKIVIKQIGTDEPVVSLYKRVPYGKHYWHTPDNETVYLSFDVCKDNQYNCDDGTCVDFSLRCDGMLDCLDESDEKNCYHINIPGYYKKYRAPHGTDTTKPLSLEIDYFSLYIDEIKDTESMLFLQFGIYTRWRDNRLHYANLKVNSNISIDSSEYNKMWLPKYNAFRQKDELLTENFGFRSVLLHTNRNGTSSGVNDVDKNIIFRGNDVEITMKNWFHGKFFCSFRELSSYPFDENLCSFTLTLDESGWKDSGKIYISFNTSNTRIFLNSKEIGRYEIHRTGIVGNAYGRLILTIVLTRKFWILYLQNAFPNTLLSIIVYSTNLFYKDLFEAALAVNVTCMLAMSGFFASLLQSLPATASIKWIELLHIKALFIASLITILQIIFFSTRNMKMEPRSKKVAELSARQSANLRLASALSLRHLKFFLEWIFSLIGLVTDIIFIVYGI